MPYPTRWARNNDVALVERGGWIDEHVSAHLCRQVSPRHACGVHTGELHVSKCLQEYTISFPRYQLARRKKKINSF